MSARARKPSSKTKAKAGAKSESRRFWLTYPSKHITSPLMWELGHKFKVVTNIRQASVSDELGIVCLELEGDRTEIKKAVGWLQSKGVSVEPVEINVLES